MNLDAVFKLLEGLTALVTIVGLPLAIITFKQERERDRREMSMNRQQRRDQIFDELDQRYVEFMRLCVEHPELDVMELPLPEPHEPTRRNCGWSMHSSRFSFRCSRAHSSCMRVKIRKCASGSSTAGGY